jgi:hypothetical protein
MTSNLPVPENQDFNSTLFILQQIMDEEEYM